MGFGFGQFCAGVISRRSERAGANFDVTGCWGGDIILVAGRACSGVATLEVVQCRERVPGRLGFVFGFGSASDIVTTVGPVWCEVRRRWKGSAWEEVGGEYLGLYVKGHVVSSLPLEVAI